jgi:CRISPR system Cascade subunit CasA
MDKFSLVEKPWIRCIRVDGSETQLGLRDILVNAHELREIVDSSPLVFVSLHRLLLAILHRNFGPSNFREWKELWNQKRWDSNQLTNYFEEWKHRFNLFDNERPFYQYPRVLKANNREADVVPVAKLMQERSSGNNATLFDHSFDDMPSSYPTSVVARYLVTRQAYSIGFGKSHPFYFKDSPVIRGLTILNLGNNLFETLALNLFVYNDERPIPKVEDAECCDMPFWERPVLDEATDTDKDGTVPRGYLDYLTWQSRRIRLFPDNEGDTVSTCQIQQNFFLLGDVHDPFKTYIPDEDNWKPIGISPDKSAWRDSHTLLRNTGKDSIQSEPVKILAQVWKAKNDREIEASNSYRFAVIGLSTEIGKTANVLTWTFERLPLPLAYLENNDLVQKLGTCLDFSEAVGSALRKGVKTLADALKTQRETFPTEANFWSRMETRFHRLLGDLPAKADEEMIAWFRDTQRIAFDAFNKTVTGLSGSAAENKAAVEAEKAMRASLNKEIKKNTSLWGTYLPKKSIATGGEQ